MYDFVLITPVYQGVDGITAFCVEKAHQAGLNFQWIVGADGKGDALICRNRSIAATKFMEYGQAPYMIFLDSDIVFEPFQLQYLYEDMKAGCDIVGGMYPVRAGTDNSSYFYKDNPPPEEIEKLGVWEIQWLSTGFMGISKYALEKISREYKYPDGTPMPLLHPDFEYFKSYPFFEAHGGLVQTEHDRKEWIWISEDWDFCEKARCVGFKVYADLRIQLGHLGNKVMTFRDVYEHKMKLKEEQKQPPANKDFISESTEGAEG